jgi:hypothetical protein
VSAETPDRGDKGRPDDTLYDAIVSCIGIDIGREFDIADQYGHATAIGRLHVAQAVELADMRKSLDPMDAAQLNHLALVFRLREQERQRLEAAYATRQDADEMVS